MTSLKNQATSGVKWTGASAVITTGLQFLQLAVLARLLAPSDFGLMAMIMIVIGLGQVFVDAGISNAIIYRQDVTRQQLSSLYWLNIMAGIVVFFVVWAATPLVVTLFNEPRLAELVFWVAFTFLIIPVGQQFQILLQKELRFNLLAWIEVAAAVIATAVSIGTALLGQGVFALVWGALANAAVRTVLLLVVGLKNWRPAWRFKISDIRSFVSFGLYQLGERTINFLNSKLDTILIGSLLGAQALGFYTLAWNLIIQPLQKLNPIITRVAFPVFAKLQDDNARLKKSYMNALDILSTMNFPYFFGLAVVAPLLVPVVFGAQWLPSVILIQVLCVVGLFQTAGNPIGSLLLSKGRADWAFKWILVFVVAKIPAIYAGVVIGGSIGVAIALVGVYVLGSILGYIVLVRRLLQPCLKEYLESMWSAFWISLCMALIVLSLAYIINLNDFIKLTVLVVSGIFTYGILTMRFRTKYILELKNTLINKDKKQGEYVCQD